MDDSVGTLQGVSASTSSAQAILDSRYSFGAQFLRGAALFARSARDLESQPLASVPDESRANHRAFVSAAVMQASAALEAEISEIMMHGPGYHLGSSGVDAVAREFLIPLEPVVDAQPTVERYQTVLHLLRKQPLDRGAEPFQSAALLARLRNELIHYKSQWVSEMSSSKLIAALENQHFAKPLFVPDSASFFPHRCLGADCAVWAVKSTHAFLRAFYARLEISCSLDHFNPPLP